MAQSQAVKEERREEEEEREGEGVVDSPEISSTQEIPEEGEEDEEEEGEEGELEGEGGTLLHPHVGFSSILKALF